MVGFWVLPLYSSLCVQKLAKQYNWLTYISPPHPSAIFLPAQQRHQLKYICLRSRDEPVIIFRIVSFYFTCQIYYGLNIILLHKNDLSNARFSSSLPAQTSSYCAFLLNFMLIRHHFLLCFEAYWII